MASNRIEQVEVQPQLIRESPHPERPTIAIPETWGEGALIQDSSGPKPWDLEVIRNERAARRKVQFSEASYTSSRRHRQSLGSRTDGGSDIKDGPVANPFLDPIDGIAPDDCSVLSPPSKPDYCHNIATVAPYGIFAIARSPAPDRKTWRGRGQKSVTRHQGPHPFVPGKVRHKTPGEVNHRHYTQYVYSKADTDCNTTHH